MGAGASPRLKHQPDLLSWIVFLARQQLGLRDMNLVRYTGVARIFPVVHFLFSSKVDDLFSRRSQ